MTIDETGGPGRRDFPFYDGRPVGLSVFGWLIVLAGTAAGFMSLFVAPMLLPIAVARAVASLLFVILPLAGLAAAAGRQWTALFPRLTWRDVWIGLVFVPLPPIAAAVIAWPLMKLGLTASNPATEIMHHLHGGELASFALGTLPQLLGEELVTILPFLAIFTLAVRGLKAPRRAAILLAWIVSAMIFGALHLSTYGWHVVQAVSVIGTSRLVLTLPYLITKSPWSSAITHIVHDWALFGFVMVMGAMVRG